MGYSLFGYTTFGATYDYRHNQVFKREDLWKVACLLQKEVDAGRPAVARTTLEVLPNAYWGLKGGYMVDNILVYLQTSREFNAQLPLETRMALHDGVNFPPLFPYLHTTLDLEARTINLIAAMTEYAVLQNADQYRAVLGRSGILPRWLPVSVVSAGLLLVVCSMVFVAFLLSMWRSLTVCGSCDTNQPEELIRLESGTAQFEKEPLL